MTPDQVKEDLVEAALRYVAAIRDHDEMGFSPNEQKMIALADEVLRLRRQLRLKQVPTNSAR